MLSMTCLLIIIKLHNSPRWKSSPLEMATVTVDTPKCDHNTNSDAAATPPTDGGSQTGQRAKGEREREREVKGKVKHSRHPETGDTYLGGGVMGVFGGKGEEKHSCRPTCDHKF
eukprot:GHVL01037277.1.p1 GENE.GHVL01037277.1~~GHVL01037277.1.p1  ORF type:complete len:114 (+),score=13.08 GHVL01037277.1:716-1057(+)